MGTPVIAILGPTATGKSELAVDLAQKLDGEVVNADALQIYRDLEIGTAKPPLEMRTLVPHHLFDVVDPDEHYSAGRFAREADQVLAEVDSRNRIGLVVGGSGLYLRALFEGLSPLPERHPRVRQELEQRLHHEGLAALRAELETVDPNAAERLEVGDTQRILRALEVYIGSGVPLSTWRETKPVPKRTLEVVRVGLTLPRTILYDRIDQRVRRMVEAGWIVEVEALLSRGYGPETRAFQAIGYRQLVRYLVEDADLDDCVEEIVRDTRRFAKRQETWFRKEPSVEWFQADLVGGDSSPVVDYIKTKGIRGNYRET